jgi:hypothetical protein
VRELNRAFPTPAVGGPRRRYGATSFDYASATRVWDAKTHTVAELWQPSGQSRSKGGEASILNDSEAITACVQEQGLGFLVLDGSATFDETRSFDEWHRGYTREGRSGATYTSNTGQQRRRKAAFSPLSLRAVWIEDLPALDAGLAGGWLRREKQGAQPVRAGEVRGAARNDKFHLRVRDASPWVVAEHHWPV